MPGSVYDSLDQEQRESLSRYPNLKNLFENISHDPDNAIRSNVATQTKNALASGSIWERASFARNLDNALANPNVRQTIITLYRNNPQLLNERMPQLLAHPENAAQILAAPAAQPTLTVPPIPVDTAAMGARPTPRATATAPNTTTAAATLPRWNYNTDGSPVTPPPAAGFDDQLAAFLADAQKNNPELIKALESLSPEQIEKLETSVRQKMEEDPEFLNKLKRSLSLCPPQMYEFFTTTLAEDPDKAFGILESCQPAIEAFDTMKESLTQQLLGVMPALMETIGSLMPGITGLFTQFLGRFTGFIQNLGGNNANPDDQPEIITNNGAQLTAQAAANLGVEGTPRPEDEQPAPDTQRRPGAELERTPSPSGPG